MSGKKDTTVLRKSTGHMHGIVLVQGCVHGTQEKMLCTVASSLSFDIRHPTVSHHGNGELRSHCKSALSVDAGGSRKCFYSWGTLSFHLKMCTFIKIYLESLFDLVSHLGLLLPCQL